MLTQYKCPICWKPLLRREVNRKAEYHACQSHGSFVHLGFFHKLEGKVEVAKTILTSRSRIIPKKKSDIEIVCSHCRSKMVSTLYSEESGIILDQCVSCNHVWFDRGELVAVAEPPSPDKIPMMPKSSQYPEDETLFPNDTYFENPIFLNPAFHLNLPVEEDVEIHYHKPFITYLLMLFIVAITAKGFIDPQFLERWMFDPEQPLSHLGFNFLTSVFLHADWVHLFGNLYFFWITSDNIENRKGGIFLLLLFVLAGITGNIFNYYTIGVLPSIGASGAISGMFAYYCFRFTSNRFHMGHHSFIWTRYNMHYSFGALEFFLIWLAYQLLGIFIGGSSVAYMAHIGGAFCGFLFFLFDSLWQERPKNQ